MRPTIFVILVLAWIAFITLWIYVAGRERGGIGLARSRARGWRR